MTAAAETSVEQETEETTDEEVVERLAPLWKVICHDDPITTMDFVVDVLRAVFRLTAARSMEVMLQVHTKGAAVVGLWPESVARRRVRTATARARAQGFPLTFSVEKDA